MADFIIDDKLANEILGYLSTKPYNEVARFINQLSQIKPLAIQTEPKKEG